MDQAFAVTIDDHLSAKRTTLEALLGALLGHLDELDVFAQQGIDQGEEIDALGIGEPGEVKVTLRAQIEGEGRGF